jgi:hypothetical protein
MGKTPAKAPPEDGLDLSPDEEEGIRHALEQAEHGQVISLDQGFDDVLEEIQAIGRLREIRRQRTG